MPKVTTVFICHATPDKPLLRRLTSDLRRYGVEVWLDEERVRVGDSLRESIERGLERADFVLIALSRQALRSAWLRRELNAAYTMEAARKRQIILPVLLEETPLPIFLRDKKYADFTADYKRGLRELVRTLVDRPSQHQMGLETDRCSIILDFVRRDGSLARYQKTHVQTCAIDGISSVTDGFLSMGTVSKFRVSPGKLGRVWKEMNQTLVETIFPERLRKDQKVKRRLKCTYEQKFRERESGGFAISTRMVGSVVRKRAARVRPLICTGSARPRLSRGGSCRRNCVLGRSFSVSLPRTHSNTLLRTNVATVMTRSEWQN